jgi:hypothetical protein
MAEFDPTKMDKAANEAANELDKIEEQFPDAVAAVQKWVKKWVMSAGYKRLGKILAGKWESDE